MKCIKCGHDMVKSTTTEAVELATGILVIRNIPCYKCSFCDEIHFTGDIVKQLEALISQAEKQAQEVVIMNFQRAA